MAEPQGPELARQEEELRALLERAVPQPAAPAQRLEGIRERIRRRRRRRAAALSGTAVLAAVAAVLALPGLVRPQGAAPHAAPSGSAGPAGGTSTSAARPAPTSLPPGYRPTGMGGLVLQRPAGWRVLADPATTSVFLSTSGQPLALPAGGCAHALDGFCTPLVRALATGGALVMFKSQPMKGTVDKLHSYALPVAAQTPYESCRAVGGTDQLSRTMVADGGAQRVVWATACLAHPTASQLGQVRQLLATAVLP